MSFKEKLACLLSEQKAEAVCCRLIQTSTLKYCFCFGCLRKHVQLQVFEVIQGRPVCTSFLSIIAPSLWCSPVTRHLRLSSYWYNMKRRTLPRAVHKTQNYSLSVSFTRKMYIIEYRISVIICDAGGGYLLWTTPPAVVDRIANEFWQTVKRARFILYENWKKNMSGMGE